MFNISINTNWFNCILFYGEFQIIPAFATIPKSIHFHSFPKFVSAAPQFKHTDCFSVLGILQKDITITVTYKDIHLSLDSSGGKIVQMKMMASPYLPEVSRRTSSLISSDLCQPKVILHLGNLHANLVLCLQKLIFHLYWCVLRTQVTLNCFHSTTGHAQLCQLCLQSLDSHVRSHSVILAVIYLAELFRAH